VHYLGIDLARPLIQEASRLDRDQNHRYQVADATTDLSLPPRTYDHAVSILALQNMADASRAIAQMAKAVKVGGDLSLVLNHPCFRIPRQSSWGEDEATKLTYRRVNRYLSPLEIPVNAHPSDPKSPVTWSYHQPLSYYIEALSAHGCYLAHVDELVSDRESQGKKRRSENRARAEFPLFAYLYAVKVRG
jgi:SAM-dependent methyltransferase